MHGLVPTFAIFLELDLLVSNKAPKQGIRAAAAAIVTRLAIVAVAVLVRIANGTAWSGLRLSPSAETEAILGVGFLEVRIGIHRVHAINQLLA